jgi:cytochrome c-type biogenesis protein CcmH
MTKNKFSLNLTKTSTKHKDVSLLHYAQLDSPNRSSIKSELSIINEERFYKLTNELRCLVCQNQTVADSNAGLAVDLKAQVAELIDMGKSDEEILFYMEERYGEFVLYNPQMNLENSALWIGPFVVILIAILVAVNTIKKYSKK